MNLSNQLNFDFFLVDKPTPEPSIGHSAAPSVEPTQAPEPLEYTLKVSSRARQVLMRVEQGRGLLVTIPRRYPKRSIPELVESQREWVEKALRDIELKTPEQYRVWPPQQLSLQATGEHIHINYKPLNSASEQPKAFWRTPEQLVLQVDTRNRPQVAACLAAVLKKKARVVLQPRLELHATQTGLKYKRLTIRGQRSLWGSYSSTGTLSLNYKLLFLTPDLVDYVLLHELAHTRHLDHSAAFWNLLKSLKQGAMELDQQLNSAGPMVPPWLELVKG